MSDDSCGARRPLLILCLITTAGCTPGRIDPGRGTAAVPAGYVATPNGVAPASCVVELAPGERLLDDGRIAGADGATRSIPSCAERGTTAVAPGGVGAPPGATLSGWIADGVASADRAFGSLTAEWTVPELPAEPGAVVYLFPGVEPASNHYILQPVLGTWAGAWTIASWNCCVDGNQIHSPQIAVRPGDRIFGSIEGSSCTGAACAAWRVTTRDLDTGEQTVLDTTAFGEMPTRLFSGALETYSVDDCGKLPASDATTFDQVTVLGVDGSAMAPRWTPQLRDGTCGTRVDATATSLTVSYRTARRVDAIVPGSDGQLHQQIWDGAWSQPQPIGGAPAAGAGVAATSWGTGRVDLFYEGSDGALHWRRYDGQWHDDVVPGAVALDPGSAPAAAAWAARRIDLFVHGVDHALHHQWYDGSWHAPERLGGTLAPGSSPAVASWAAQRLDVFAVGSDGVVSQLTWDGAWHPFAPIGMNVAAGSGLAAASWAPNRLDVFGRAGDGTLVHDWYDGTWHAAESLGGFLAPGSAPAVSSFAPSRLDVLVHGGDDRLYHRWFDVPGGWSAWESLGMVIVGSPAASRW